MKSQRVKLQGPHSVNYFVPTSLPKASRLAKVPPRLRTGFKATGTSIHKGIPWNSQHRALWLLSSCCWASREPALWGGGSFAVLARVHPFELTDLGLLVTLSAAIAHMEVSVSPCAKWPLALHLSLGSPRSFGPAPASASRHWEILSVVWQRCQ